jgi:hypothetical protein
MNPDMNTMSEAEKLAYLSIDNDRLGISPTTENIIMLIQMVGCKEVDLRPIANNFITVSTLRMQIKDKLTAFYPEQGYFTY